MKIGEIYWVNSHQRFLGKIGSISGDEIFNVKKSIALILDIDPEHCVEV